MLPVGNQFRGAGVVTRLEGRYISPAEKGHRDGVSAGIPRGVGINADEPQVERQDAADQHAYAEDVCCVDEQIGGARSAQENRTGPGADRFDERHRRLESDSTMSNQTRLLCLLTSWIMRGGIAHAAN